MQEAGHTVINTETRSMWRFRAFLPVNGERIPFSAGEGNTPLHPMTHAQGKVWVKDETRNPTGTFKDRGASVAVTSLKALQVRKLVLSSEGNAGSSFALYTRLAGIACRVFLPRKVNPAKVALSKKLGAKVTQVNGTIADAGVEAEKSAKKRSEYNASTFVTPYRHDGKGTMALEICEQMNWRAPDWVVYPVGGGVGLVGMWKMFSILERIGWIRDKPHILAVQPSGCAPVVKAYNSRSGDVAEWKSPHTFALGLKIPKPLAGRWILKSLRESNGLAVTVTDPEIQKSKHDLATKEGLLLEPSSAAAFAGLSKLYEEREIGRREQVVVIATGSALKTLEQL